MLQRMSGTASADIRTGAERTLELLEAQVGRSLDEVETPAAVVDLDRLEANLRRLQAYADSHAIALWPHTKTHKSPEIGLRQLALGAGGLTVAKTGEAEVFQEAGAPRLLVHYPPFGADKWERLARLAAEGVELTVAVDSLAPAAGLSARAGRRARRLRALGPSDRHLRRRPRADRGRRGLEDDHLGHAPGRRARCDRRLAGREAEHDQRGARIRRRLGDTRAAGGRR